jgi:hypothetical protein
LKALDVLSRMTEDIYNRIDKILDNSPASDVSSHQNFLYTNGLTSPNSLRSTTASRGFNRTDFQCTIALSPIMSYFEGVRQKAKSKIS